jgi:hypothetical protein
VEFHGRHSLSCSRGGPSASVVRFSFIICPPCYYYYYYLPLVPVHRYCSSSLISFSRPYSSSFLAWNYFLTKIFVFLDLSTHKRRASPSANIE